MSNILRDNNGDIIGVSDPDTGRILWVPTNNNQGASGNQGDTTDFDWDSDDRPNNSDPEDPPAGTTFARRVVENIGAFDQKQERIKTSGELRPQIVEDKDSDGTKWTNKQSLAKDGEGRATYKVNTATSFTKLRFRDFRAGIPQNAKIRGFKVTIKRRKRLTNGGISEDANDPVLEETLKLDFNKWKLTDLVEG